MSLPAGNDARIAAAEARERAASSDAGRLEAWRPLLTDAEPDLRCAALHALATRRGDPVGALARDATGDPDAAVRRCAVFALGQQRADMGTAQAGHFAELLRALGDADADVRAAAADGLRYGDPASAPALLAALQDPDARVRCSVLTALGTLEAHAGATAMLASFRHDPVDDVRRAALAALADLGGAEAGEALCEAAIDADPGMRREAARACAIGNGRRIPAPALLAALPRLLGDVDIELRRDAAAALAGLLDELPLEGAARDADAAPPCQVPRGLLAAALADPVPSVRIATLEGLPWDGGRAAGVVAADLSPALRDPERDVRCAAAVALGRLGDGDAAPELLPLLDDPDPQLRGAVLDALQLPADARLPGALAKLLVPSQTIDPPLVAAAARCLARRGRSDDAVPLLLPLLQREHIDPEVVDALIDLPDPRALPCLLALLDNTDDAVVANAALALAAIGDDRAVEPLAALLATRGPYVRRRVVWALGFLHRKRVVPWLVAALDDAAEGVSRAAADVLVSICTRRELDALAHRLTDDGIELLCEALEEIGETVDRPPWRRILALLPGRRGTTRPRLLRLGSLSYE